MAKPLTAKDVIYALQFLRARLTMQADGKWTLEPGGQKVPPRVADEARAHGGVVGAPYRPGEASYVWATAA